MASQSALLLFRCTTTNRITHICSTSISSSGYIYNFLQDNLQPRPCDCVSLLGDLSYTLVSINDEILAILCPSVISQKMPNDHIESYKVVMFLLVWITYSCRLNMPSCDAKWQTVSALDTSLSVELVGSLMLLHRQV